MTISKRCAAGVIGAVLLGLAEFPAWAQSAEAPQPVFACSLGKKSVSVIAVGHELIYKFGTSTKTEMSIVGSAHQRNVLYREDRYAGMEHQLRFVSGDYSYIVYNMEGNSQTGAKAISGLTVMKGNKAVADMSCTHYAEFGIGFDYGSLPEDTANYSAMETSR